MSVINQMLHDLDTRQSQRAMLDPLAGLHSSQKLRVFQLRWLGLGIIFVLSVALLIWVSLPSWQMQRPSFIPPFNPQGLINDHPLKTPVNTTQPRRRQPPITSQTQPSITLTSFIATITPLTFNQIKPKASIEKSFVPLTASQLPKQRYQQGLTLMNQGQLQLAIEKFNRALITYPNFIQARLTLASLLIKQNQLPKTVVLLSQGLKLAPNNTMLIELKARTLYQLDQLQQALTTLLQGSPPLAKNPSYYALMAALYEKLQQPALAAELYQDLVAIEPRNGILWLGLGISLEQLNKPNEAIDAYEGANSSGNLTPALQAFVLSRLNILKE